jgi:hypothetical protein
MYRDFAARLPAAEIEGNATNDAELLDGNGFG